MYFLGNVPALEWPLPSRSSAPTSSSTMRRYRHFASTLLAQVSGTGTTLLIVMCGLPRTNRTNVFPDADPTRLCQRVTEDELRNHWRTGVMNRTIVVML